MKTHIEPGQNGFSLVEVVVATMILTIGILAMAASTGFISGEFRSAKLDTERMQAKRTMVENIRSQVWSNLASDNTGQTVGRYLIRRTVTQPTNNSKKVQLMTTGPAFRIGKGARVNVTDTFSVFVARP